MAGEPTMTVVGNLTADPELRFTTSGIAVANFTVASTPRVQVDGEWEDGDTTFFRCAVWREYAENVVESLRKGMRVVVLGRFKTRPWEDNDGVERISIELDVEEVGPSLRFGSIAGFEKANRTNEAPQRSQGRQGGRGGDDRRQSGRQSQQRSQGRQGGRRGGNNADPWSGGNNADPWGANQSEEPPF